MARPGVFQLLSAAAATGASNVVEPRGACRSFQVVISDTASVELQVSNDPLASTDPASATWVTAETVTASGGYEHSEVSWRYTRANVSAYTSGTVDCWLSVL